MENSVLFLLLCVVFWFAIRRLLSVKEPIHALPGPPKASWIQGHFPQIFHQDAWEFHKNLARTYGRVLRLQGMLNDTVVYTFDPKALHHIFIRKSHVFEETPSFIAGQKIVLGDGLTATLGEQHRRQRKMLNPVFSIAQMRELTPVFDAVVGKLPKAFHRQLSNGPKEIEMISWMSRVALEVIGQSGLGHSFDELAEDGVEHPYLASLKQLGPLGNKLAVFRLLFFPHFTKWYSGPRWFKRLVVDLLPWDASRKIRDIVDLMHKASVEVVAANKKAIGNDRSGVGEGKDIMSTLLRANMAASEEDRLEDAELIAQVSTFMAAAVETSSTSICRILHLLALHPDVQVKLREEIREAREKHDRVELDYDRLNALPYLDAVCKETLRLYPAAPVLLRQCREDAILPFSQPIKGTDSHEMTEILLRKGTKIIITIRGSNTDPELWGADSYEWKPERWLEPLPESVTNAKIPGVYNNMMTFIGGNRACIGVKFAELEIKMVLFKLLEQFAFSLPKQEIHWSMTGISAPTADLNDRTRRPEMPLLVSVAE